jgi:hypothetical protein
MRHRESGEEVQKVSDLIKVIDGKYEGFESENESENSGHSEVNFMRHRESGEEIAIKIFEKNQRIEQSTSSMHCLAERIFTSK